MENNFIVGPAPHKTSTMSTNVLLIGMLVALLPSAISGVISFGINALYLILVSVASAYLFELLYKLSTKNKIDWFDFSSIVTGLMTALILPVQAPIYLPIIANFLAIVIFKQCFGGLGRNFINPAAGARMVLTFICSGLVLAWFTGGKMDINAMSPLGYFINGDYSSITLRSLFFGTAPGAIGTASIFCALVSGIVLMIFKVTDYIIPVGSILAFIVTVWVGKGAIAIVPYLFSGSFLFVAMFMAVDPSSSPRNVYAKFLYSALFGLFAGLFRINFIMGESSVFIALVMANLLTPVLDKIFVTRPLGLRRG